ncbi:hypothetical protein DVH24_018677, partial [Malus domestica]
KKNEEICGNLEKYQCKCLPSFADKSSAEAYAKLNYDIGGLVQEKCSIKLNSWKMVPMDMKNSMVQHLSVLWDVDETDEKQQKYVDDLLKKKFREWKFNVQRAADRAQVDNATVDATANDEGEE